MTVPAITVLPTAPARTDTPATFNTRADAFLGALYSPFSTQMNTSIAAFNTDFITVGTNVTAAALSATNSASSATAAAASATAAAHASAASAWVSGTSYTAGDVVYSPIDFQSYRCILATSGTTDPSADTTYWVLISASSGGVSYVAKTATYTAADLEGVLADTSGGAFTVNLPASPSAGAQVIIADSGGAFGTNNLTTGRNSSTINGTAADLLLDIDGVSVQFVYDGSTWEVYAQVGGNGGSVVTLAGVQTLTNKTLTAPVLTAPVLGTPASGTATNLTGLPPAGVTGTAAILGANTFTALQTQSAGADIASATAVDLTAATGNVVVITGTTTSTSLTMTKGQQMTLIAAAKWPLTFHATTMNINGGVSYTCAAGDRLYVVKDDDDVIRVSVTKQDGTAVVTAAAGATFEAVASGTIANGDTVIINADGTVSSVAGTGASASLGADAEFESGGVSNIRSCYDTATDRVIICYKSSATGWVNVQVGQISGTTITFGAVTVVGSNIYDDVPSIAYDTNADRVVLHYKAAAPAYGTAAVGTVTGGATNTTSFGTPVTVVSSAVRNTAIVYLEATTKMVLIWNLEGSPYNASAAVGTVDAATETITFGTPVTVNTGRSYYLNTGCFYDPDTERVIACFMDRDSSDNGMAVVIQNTTGTTLTVGAEAEFNAADVEYCAGGYDTDQNKGIVMFTDKGDSNYLKAVVLTITGGVTDTIAIGTEVTVKSAAVTHIEAGFDETANKVVCIYNDSTNTQGSVISGTISGTGASATSTWDDILEVCGSYLQYPAYAYDPDAGKSVLCYVDGSDSDSGHSRIFTVPYGSTNMTSENYIGISDAAYSSSATATIQIVGSVDDAQTSLTAGQTYYISFDGSLVLTPIVPSVVAGKALAATKLMITYS